MLKKTTYQFEWKEKMHMTQRQQCSQAGDLWTNFILPWDYHPKILSRDSLKCPKILNALQKIQRLSQCDFDITSPGADE